MDCNVLRHNCLYSAPKKQDERKTAVWEAFTAKLVKAEKEGLSVTGLGQLRKPLRDLIDVFRLKMCGEPPIEV
ncbi:hypothetical protein H310_12852 [Aphanomyces invadans]|uniref:Uncharacterized protein n=1 Tax=Aphanomyces invadans TaxID=157072 RepID=A0A024THF7_9STRA|nr:hypothetical protein H310_12852 [Aphanomyces invadans]ETV93021.1 hypothetical protein H310_12852 [Aphanomyces invadans]|eukprot:XP_008878286.1 hypothetical protein H310_12852 [Aphanomyces invadans]